VVFFNFIFDLETTKLQRRQALKVLAIASTVLVALIILVIAYDQSKFISFLILRTGGRLTENQLIEMVFYQLIKIFIIS
jgi:hypothetical protein